MAYFTFIVDLNSLIRGFDVVKTQSVRASNFSIQYISKLDLYLPDSSLKLGNRDCS